MTRLTSRSVRVSSMCSRSACQSPMPVKPDARGLLAAVAQVEEAPLAPDVHLDGPGRRPVEADELVAIAHRRTT